MPLMLFPVLFHVHSRAGRVRQRASVKFISLLLLASYVCSQCTYGREHLFLRTYYKFIYYFHLFTSFFVHSTRVACLFSLLSPLARPVRLANELFWHTNNAQHLSPSSLSAAGSRREIAYIFNSNQKTSAVSTRTYILVRRCSLVQHTLLSYWRELRLVEETMCSRRQVPLVPHPHVRCLFALTFFVFF